MNRWKTPAHNRAKATITLAAAHGAAIEYLPDAPRFRFTPNGPAALDSGKPTTRGAFTYANRWKLKNWTPAKLSLLPQYGVPMTGDSRVLTDARRAWAEGNPVPLRQYLAALAARELAQRETAQFKLAA